MNPSKMLILEIINSYKMSELERMNPFKERMNPFKERINPSKTSILEKNLTFPKKELTLPNLHYQKVMS